MSVLNKRIIHLFTYLLTYLLKRNDDSMLSTNSTWMLRPADTVQLRETCCFINVDNSKQHSTWT